MSEPLHNFNEVPRIGAHTITSNPVEILDRYGDFYYLGNAFIEYKETQNPAKLRGELLALFAVNIGSVCSEIPEKVLLNLLADLVEYGAKHEHTKSEAYKNIKSEAQEMICLMLNKMPGFADNILGQAREMIDGFKNEFGITVQGDDTLRMNPLADNRPEYYVGLKRVNKFLLITDGMAEADCVAIPSQERLELAIELFGFNQLFTFAMGAIREGAPGVVTASVNANPVFVPT